MGGADKQELTMQYVYPAVVQDTQGSLLCDPELNDSTLYPPPSTEATMHGGYARWVGVVGAGG